MSKLKKIKNGEYIGGDKYTITPDAGGKSRVVFSPDNILTEPTPVGAEILNEMQLNQVYTLDTTRSVDGQKEVYTATLEGFTEFDSPDLNFNLKINSENTNSQTYLRLNGIDYLIECKIENLKAGSIIYAKKINNIIKIIGFNANKSDATNLKDSETLATSMAVAKTMEKAEEALNSAGGKEPAFNKNTAFNKNFGTGQNEILEGSKLAEILGIEYGGVLNNTNAKVAGMGYYDTANKKIYKCTANTSINYADAGYFIEVSNNDLLGKLQNLINSSGDIQNKIVFRQYYWNSPPGNTEQVVIPIGINFKNVLSYSLSASNGKFPLHNRIENSNIVLGMPEAQEGYWINPQNTGGGIVYLVLLI